MLNRLTEATIVAAADMSVLAAGMTGLTIYAGAKMVKRAHSEWMEYIPKWHPRIYDRLTALRRHHDVLELYSSREVIRLWAIKSQINLTWLFLNSTGWTPEPPPMRPISRVALGFDFKPRD